MQAQAAGGDEFRRGVLFPLDGLDIRQSAQVKLHTKGTATGMDVDLQAGYGVGDTTIHVDGGDGGTILAVTGGRGGVLGNVQGMTREQYCGVKLGLIVPGHSIGDVYLSQSRKSVLKAVPGLTPVEHGFTTKNANGLMLGGQGLIGIVFQIHFGVCSFPALKPADVPACKNIFTQSRPDQVATVQTSSPGYTTKGGLGPDLTNIGSKVPREAIKRSVEIGPGIMPSFRDLGEENLNEVADYLASLN